MFAGAMRHAMKRAEWALCRPRKSQLRAADRIISPERGALASRAICKRARLDSPRGRHHIESRRIGERFVRANAQWISAADRSVTERAVVYGQHRRATCAASDFEQRAAVRQDEQIDGGAVGATTSRVGPYVPRATATRERSGRVELRSMCAMALPLTITAAIAAVMVSGNAMEHRSISTRPERSLVAVARGTRSAELATSLLRPPSSQSAHLAAQRHAVRNPKLHAWRGFTDVDDRTFQLPTDERRRSTVHWPARSAHRCGGFAIGMTFESDYPDALACRSRGSRARRAAAK